MIIFVVLVVVLGFIASQLLWLKFNGSPVAEPVTAREPQTIGAGGPLVYVVLGDSTAVSQGSTYEESYAVATAAYLAESHQVTWLNAGVAGARAKDVLDSQLPQVLPHKADVALIAVGANDVTHLTSISSVYDSLQKTIQQFKTANPNVRIILTGSPDMGGPRRLPQPLRYLAGARTASLNARLDDLADNKTVFFAPIAEKTGPAFRKHPELFASDNFHPNADGYALWSPVLIDTLARAGF